MGNLNMFKERNPQVCLTEGSYAGRHTRWRGQESLLFYILFGPPPNVLTCNTQGKCIGGLIPRFPLGAYVLNGRPPT